MVHCQLNPAHVPVSKEEKSESTKDPRGIVEANVTIGKHIHIIEKHYHIHGQYI